MTYRRVADLQPNPKNPRLHQPQQIRQLKQSIDNFGFNIPIVIDECDRVICGHGRVQAARELGIPNVPTIEVSHLTESQKIAFAIADNKLSELSQFDQRLLADQFRALSLDVEFDLETTGFQVAEIDIILDGVNSQSDEQIDPADALPPQTSNLSINRLGDLWQLGRHRLLCGSAPDPDAFARLMDGELAAAVITDPPFNVRVDGHVSGLGEQKHREFAMASGEMTSHAFQNFLTRATKLFARHSIDGSLHYVFDWRHLSEALAAGTESYTDLKNICVWSKHNAGMGSFYRRQHELVLLYKNGRASQAIHASSHLH